MKATQDVGMLAAWKKDSQREDVDADFIVHDLVEIPLLVENLTDKGRDMAITGLPNRNS